MRSSLLISLLILPLSTFAAPISTFSDHIHLDTLDTSDPKPLWQRGIFPSGVSLWGTPTVQASKALAKAKKAQFNANVQNFKATTAHGKAEKAAFQSSIKVGDRKHWKAVAEKKKYDQLQAKADAARAEANTAAIKVAMEKLNAKAPVKPKVPKTPEGGPPTIPVAPPGANPVARSIISPSSDDIVKLLEERAGVVNPEAAAAKAFKHSSSWKDRAKPKAAVKQVENTRARIFRTGPRPFQPAQEANQRLPPS